MQRHYEPFDNKRFIGDADTMKVHDLASEKNECEIDFIELDHVVTFDRDRLSTAENMKYTHCAHCIGPESSEKSKRYLGKHY